MAEDARYVPAAGRDFLTPFYDGFVRLTMREETFRARVVDQVLAGLGPGGRILEIGCGTGALTERLATAAPPEVTVTGLDGDGRVLERARARLAGTGVELVEAGVDRMPFDDAGFDRVVASLLLHHLDDARKAAALAEAHRVLAPAGSLHVADWGPPSGLVPRAGFAALRALDGRENTAAHAEGRIPALIESTGFSSVERRGRLATVLGTVELIAADRGVGIA